MKKICLAVLFVFIFNSFIQSQNWFPLEVGNKSHAYLDLSHQIQYGSWLYGYYFKTLSVTDTVHIENKKFFRVNGFFDFPDGTILRYDNDSSRIIIYKNNVEYIYMDFSLPNGNIMTQIQPDGTFKSITILSSSTVIMDDTLNLKGYFREGMYSNRYKKGWYYFSPGLGPVVQNESSDWIVVTLEDFRMIEYLFYDSQGNIDHKKHSYKADIQFSPIIFLPFQTRLTQDFKIQHPLTVYVPYYGYTSRTYIDSAYLESYYSNGFDSIYNPLFSINSTSEIDYSLNFPIDTTLYNQGYYLYYRIIAKDKGLIPSYYYKPDSGYYKLYWRDSITSALNENDIVIKEFELSQNYPNPFNPSTKISWQSPFGGWQTLKVYDILGNEVATLVNEYKNAGSYEVEFNLGRSAAADSPALASGIYFYQLRIGDPSTSSGQSFVETKKMILLK